MKPRSLKFKILLTAIALCCIICIALVLMYSSVIFQRGNPVPYLIAATKISASTPYVQVKHTNSETVYITKRGECNELLQSFAESAGAELQEQFGGTYFFTDGENKWMITSGTYWRNYTVWEVPVIKGNE